MEGNVQSINKRKVQETLIICIAMQDIVTIHTKIQAALEKLSRSAKLPVS